MDEWENESELPATERVEKLTLSAEKHVVDVGGQDDVKALFDTEPSCENGNSSSELLVTENSLNSFDVSTFSGANCNPDPAENSFSTFENVAEVLSPSAAKGTESTGINSIEPATEQSTDSLIDRSVEAASNSVENVDDTPFVVDDNSGDMISVKTSDMSLSFETLSRDNSNIVHDESSLYSAKEPTDVHAVHASIADAHSSSAMSSVAESYDMLSTETADLTIIDGSLQPESTTKGKCISQFLFSLFLRSAFCVFFSFVIIKYFLRCFDEAHFICLRCFEMQRRPHLRQELATLPSARFLM